MNDRIAVRTKAVFVSSNLLRTSQRLMLCSRLKRDAATDSRILSPAENVPSSRIVLKKISSRSRFTCCQTRESWANADVRIMSAARQSDARLNVFICSSRFGGTFSVLVKVRFFLRLRRTLLFCGGRQMMRIFRAAVTFPAMLVGRKCGAEPIAAAKGITQNCKGGDSGRLVRYMSVLCVTKIFLTNY